MNKIFSGILAAMLFTACLPYDTAMATTLTDISNYEVEIKNLIDECAANGIPTDYEKSALAIIERYSKELDESPVMEEYILDSLKRIYESTVNSLEGYLSGEREAFDVPVLQSERLAIADRGFKGVVSKNGDFDEKPVFLNGVGHWKQVRKDLDFLEAAGLNHIQTEVSMSEVLCEPNPADNWEVIRQIGDTTRVSQSTSVVYRGQNSLCMTDTDTSWTLNRLTMVHQKISVEPLTKYKYMFFVKRKTAENFWFSLKGKNQNSDCYKNLSQTGEDSEFVPCSGEYTTGEDETELDLTFVNEKGAEYIYIDTVAVFKDGTNVNLVNNFSFENLTDTGFQINEDAVDEIRVLLENAAAHHIKVDLLISTHNIPSFLPVLYPELEYSGYGFFSYDPLMEKSREMIKKYLESLCEAIKDCTALNSICLSNEPSFISAYEPERYNPAWHSWLKEKYVDIESLNAAYDSSYDDFDVLTLSQIFDIGRYRSKHPMYKDYKQFNEELFADWHAWMAEVVKGIIPTVFVHSKTLNYIGMEDVDPELRSQMFNGANYELFSRFSDLNGCDSTGHIQKKHQQFVLDMHYDLFESIKAAPVINSENHIIRENSHEAAQYAYSAIWQGAVHGLGASATWIWDKQYEYAKQEGHYDGILQLKPEHLWQLSRVTMDMNRVSDELAAIQSIKPEVGILYSETARVYSDSYMNSTYKAYKAVSSTGEKVHFITDTGNKNFNDLKLIIVPDAVCVTDDIFNAIKDYNGKLLVIGENSLSRTENNQARDASEVAAVLQGAEVVASAVSGTEMTSPTTDELEEIVSKYVKIFGRGVAVTEAETKDVPSDVSWIVTEYQGKKLVNICNYGVNPVKLSVSGSAAWKDLITGEIVPTELAVKPHTPMLLLQTNEAPTAEADAYITKLMPITPILRYRDGYKVSWVNPDNDHIKKISLYEVQNDKESLICDEFSTEANMACSYHADTTHDMADYFKIVMEFDNAPSSEFVLGGIMPSGLGGEWTAMPNNRTSPICYQFDTGFTTDSHNGDYALRFAANFKDYDGSYVNINAPEYEYSVEEGKSYRVSFWMKSDNVSSVLIKPGVLKEKRVIGRIADREYFSETRNDWCYYYYDTKAEESAACEGNFLLVFDEMSNEAIIDNISIYELGENGEPIGENLFTVGDFEGVNASDCKPVADLELTKRTNDTLVSWTEPDSESFAAVKLYINGHLAGKLTKGITEVPFASLNENDVVEIRTVDSFGIEGNSYIYYPVKFLQNNAVAQEIIAGGVYDVSADTETGNLYIAFYKGKNELSDVKFTPATEDITVTVPDECTYLKTFLWNDDLSPLMKGCKREIKGKE